MSHHNQLMHVAWNLVLITWLLSYSRVVYGLFWLQNTHLDPTMLTLGKKELLSKFYFSLRHYIFLPMFWTASNLLQCHMKHPLRDCSTNIQIFLTYVFDCRCFPNLSVIISHNYHLNLTADVITWIKKVTFLSSVPFQEEIVPVFNSNSWLVSLGCISWIFSSLFHDSLPIISPTLTLIFRPKPLLNAPYPISSSNPLTSAVSSNFKQTNAISMLSPTQKSKSIITYHCQKLKHISHLRLSGFHLPLCQPHLNHHFENPKLKSPAPAHLPLPLCYPYLTQALFFKVKILIQHHQLQTDWDKGII